MLTSSNFLKRHEELSIPAIHPLTDEGATTSGTSSGSSGGARVMSESDVRKLNKTKLGKLWGRHRLKHHDMDGCSLKKVKIVGLKTNKARGAMGRRPQASPPSHWL